MTHNNDLEKGTGAFRQDQSQLVFSQGFSFSGYERDGLYLNRANRKFTDISGVSGIDSITDGRAAVFADFDNDGDYDVFITTIQGPAHLLFRNNVGQDNHFLRLSLEGGKGVGKDAYGSVARLKTSAGILTKVKAGGQGFISQHDPRLLFGLGQDERAEWIEVTWPDGTKERFQGDLQAGKHFLLKQGSGKASALVTPSTQLPNPLSRDELFFRSLKIKLGNPFPDAEIKPLNGPMISLQKLLHPGHKTLVNLWATWCLPCAKEMPELEKIRTKLSIRHIDLVGLNIDTDPHLELIRGYLHKTPVQYPIYVGGTKLIEQIFASEEISVPLSILLDESGNVEEIISGWSAQTRQRFLALAGGEHN